MKMIKACVIAVALVVGGTWAEVVPTVYKVPVDGASVTNFVKAFFAAYDGKNFNALGKMIANPAENKRIYSACKRNKHKSKTVICGMEIGEVTTVHLKVSTKKEAVKLDLRVKAFEDGVKLVSSWFPEIEDVNAQVLAATDLARELVDAVNSSDTNRICQILNLNVDSPNGFSDALQIRNLAWLESAIANGEKISVGIQPVARSRDRIFARFIVGLASPNGPRKNVLYEKGYFSVGFIGLSDIEEKRKKGLVGTK